VVLDPTFERTPSGIRLSARLVRCGDGSRLWQGDFADSADRTAASTVADAVASELGAFPHVQTDRDPGPDRPPGRRSRIEVYELCGRGRSHLLSASMVEVPKAIEAFRAAVELDPSYAPAHAGLAQAYCAQAAMRVAPPFDAYRDARAAALRALAVDDGSADAQLALGSVLFLAEWDWHGAERCLQRAIEINPNHVEAHLMYGRLLEALGRTEDALDLKLRAFERDPFSPLVHVQIAHCCWNLRRYDDAIEWANKALALDPRHPIAREFLASASLFKGDFDRYIVEVVAHAAALGAPVDCVAPLEAAYAEGGRSGFWRVSLEQMSRNPRVPAYQFAVFLAQAGDVDGAFHHLDRAIVEHDPSLVDLAVAPQWDSLRADPRFDACVSRMGLHGAAAAGTPPVQSRAEA
jgi:tetratricopeptide (TPR) repeat protein